MITIHSEVAPGTQGAWSISRDRDRQLPGSADAAKADAAEVSWNKGRVIPSLSSAGNGCIFFAKIIIIEGFWSPERADPEHTLSNRSENFRDRPRAAACRCYLGPLTCSPSRSLARRLISFDRSTLEPSWRPSRDS
jgi:hypothetical protein